MFKKSYLFILAIILVGCSQGTEESINQEDFPEPHLVGNETPMKEHLTYYKEFVDARELQKENLADNDFDHYTDPYTTEESQAITEELMKNRDIIVAEARIIRDQVFVSVRLRENNYGRNHNMNIITEIEEQVRKVIMDDEKQITIYTDHAQWQRLKNHHAEPRK